MFLRCKVRRKDGKQHRYWSVVENTRVAGGRVVQTVAPALGETEFSPAARPSWRLAPRPHTPPIDRRVTAICTTAAAGSKTEDVDQVALAAGFDTQDAEAVPVVVEGDTLDEAG
jgi:hypothetical protein